VEVKRGGGKSAWDNGTTPALNEEGVTKSDKTGGSQGMRENKIPCLREGADWCPRRETYSKSGTQEGGNEFVPMD